MQELYIFPYRAVWMARCALNRHVADRRRKKRSRPISRVLSRAAIPLRKCVAALLKRPTRKRTGPVCSPARAASLFGLAPGGVCRAGGCCHHRGALLPHHFTLTCARHEDTRRRYLSVALSVDSRPPGVTWHLQPKEPGLSSGRIASSGCLADSGAARYALCRGRATRREEICPSRSGVEISRASEPRKRAVICSSAPD